MNKPDAPVIFDSTMGDGNDHLSLLLADYAKGSQVRSQIIDNIVARFRPVLKANGPNYDGPLYAEIERAMKAAEEFGRIQDSKNESK